MAKQRTDGRTRSGRFQKGISGNPTGGRKDAKTEAVAATRSRFDDWQNYFTGMGIFGRDKRMGAQFAAHTLSFDQLKDLWLCDDLAARAVETIPREAMRQGYDVTIASSQDDDEPEDLGYMGYANPELTQPEEDDDSLDHAELASEVTQKLDDLGADEYLEIAGSYERGYGGGALLIGANDGQEDLTKPLDLDRVRSLDWLTPLEARELLPLYAYNDPRASKYGQPEIYQLQSRSTLPSYGGGSYSTTMMVHETRLVIFPGIRVSRYQSHTSRGGWGEAVLNRVYRVLRDFNTAWQSAGVLVTDFAQSVIKIAGLWEALALDGEKAFQNRLAAMEYGRSTVNAVTIDAGDSYERQQTPLSGLPDLLEKFAVRLAAACDMPLTLLFGTSPAGMNATGESDIRFFYDRVASYQKRKMEPALRRLCQVIFRTIGNKEEPEKWAIKFRPLWQDSAKDKASAMLTQAQADSAWITAGVLSPEEVAAAHWGKGEYDPNITIDFDARDSQEHAVTPPVTAPDKAATTIDPNTGLPMDVDPVTGLPANNAPQLDPETGEPLPPDEQPPQVDPKTGQPIAPQGQVPPKGPPGQQPPQGPTAPQQVAPQGPPKGPPGQQPPQGPPGQRPVPGQPQLRVVPGGQPPGQQPVPPKKKAPPPNLFARPRPTVASEDSADRLRHDGDWEEDKHPRANDGKFGSGSGSSGGSVAEKIAAGKAAIANAPKSHDARISKGNKPKPGEVGTTLTPEQREKAKAQVAHAFSGQGPSPAEISRRAENSSYQLKRAKGLDKGEKVARNIEAASKHEEAARLGDPSKAEAHKAAAGQHRAAAEALQAGRKAPSKAPPQETQRSEPKRETVPNDRGETIKASHGLTDEKGRQIGGSAEITKHEGENGPEYHVYVQPERNGKKFGALVTSGRMGQGGDHGLAITKHGSLEEARAAANKKLDLQKKNYEKKYGDHRPQAEKEVGEQAKHEGKHGGEHAGDEPADKGHSAEGSGHSTEKAAGEKNAKGKGEHGAKGKGEGKGKEPKEKESKFGEKLSEFTKGGTELVAGEEATKLAEQLGPGEFETEGGAEHNAEHGGGEEHDEPEDDEREKE